MSKAHANISIFVPHIGCQNMCSFCNQRHITGSFKAPTQNDVINAVDSALNSEHYNPDNTEIAFFGGSFTAINRNYMIRLLKTASYFADQGVVKGIRISTRPDAIDDEILCILKQYNVTAIELGAQSLDDKVLKMNNRGHTANQVEAASSLIKSYGFELGLQMMTGLYGDTDKSAIMTAKRIIEISPETVRIYPTIVLADTDLQVLYAEKIYIPQTLDEAISLAGKLYLMFEDAEIKVIRLGLHSIESDSYIAGPWHPAFSELCQSEIYLSKVRLVLKLKGTYDIYVNKSAVSKMVGQKRKNIIALEKEGFFCKVKTDNNLNDFEFFIRAVKQ